MVCGSFSGVKHCGRKRILGVAGHAGLHQKMLAAVGRAQGTKVHPQRRKFWIISLSKMFAKIFFQGLCPSRFSSTTRVQLREDVFCTA